jgi:hypothetical protein
MKPARTHFLHGPAFFFLACLAGLITGLAAPVRVTAGDPPVLTISADRQFAYAQTLLQDRDFRTAEVELKRFVHFFPQDPRIHEARFKTGLALFLQERFHEAARQFNDIVLSDPDLSSMFTTEAFFLQSRAFKHMGNLGYAQVVLQNFLMLADDPAVRDRIFLDLAGLHVHALGQSNKDELDQALAALNNMSSGGPLDGHKNALIHRIRDARSMPEKSPVLAGLFAVVPGGGFLYTGRIKDAAAAFLLNAGLGLAAWKAFDQGNPALGAVVGFAGAGFYSGSIYGSISAAHKHNLARKTQILDRPFQVSGSWLSNDPAVLFTFSRPF